jgi:hypothetical protein
MLQKFSTSNSNHFLNINQVFQEISQIVFHTSAVCVNETSAVRCFEMSAALSAVSVRKISPF